MENKEYLERVYFTQEPKDHWVVKELSDIYSFRMSNNVDIKSVIINWSKNNDREIELKNIYDIKSDVRLYDTEIGGRKIHFLLRYDIGEFILSTATVEDDYEISQVLRETGYFFVGELLEINNQVI